MSAKLRVVPRQERKVDATVVEIGAVIYPRRFGARIIVDGANHHRQLKQGEISRFVKMVIELFFTETLDGEDRHQPINLYDLKQVLAPDVEKWVRRMSGNKEFQLFPWKLAQILRTMEVGGVSFRLEGKTVLLPESSNDNIHPKLKLIRR